jgi:hypothetical protein
MSSQQLLFNPMTGLFDLVTKPEATVEELTERVGTLEAKYVRTTRFTEVESGTSGQATVAFGSTIILDDFSGGIDALVTAFANGAPEHTHVYTAQGELITTSFDSLGNYSLSGVPATYPVAVVYRVRTPLIDFDDTDPDIDGGNELEESKWVRRNITAANSPFSPESVNGVIYAVDLTGGSVILNLPAVNTSIEGHECYVYIERAGTGNYLDVVCNGAQTIRGATSHRLTTVRDGFMLVAHTYLTDHWDAPDWAKPIKGDTQIEGLTIEGPIQSATIAEVIQEIGHSMAETGRCGITQWEGSGAYWSWTPGDPGTFTLLRPGEGYLRYKEVNWLALQTLSLTYGESVYAYIDADGVLQKSTSNTDEDRRNRINLLFIQNDINGEFVVVRNDHSFYLDTGARSWIDAGFGTVITSAPGAANISRYTTGTGGATTDRMINISAGTLIDADIVESWPAVTTGASVNHTYRTAGGAFARDSFSQQFPMKYNLNGVPTALNNGQFGVFRLFLTKSSRNDSPPQFISEMHTAVFGNATAAQTAIASGTISNFGAFNNDLAQVGYVTVAMNSSGGYVSATQIEKTTFRQTTGGTGVGSTAANVVTSTTTFDKLLSATDTTVQQALETIDEQAVSLAGVQTLTGAKTFAANADAFTSQVILSNTSIGTSSGICQELADGADKLKLCLGNAENTTFDGLYVRNTYAGVIAEGARDLIFGAPASRVINFRIGNIQMGRFHQGAGSTPRFGIGTATPEASLQTHNPNFAVAAAKLTNGYTGANATDGVDLIIGTDKSAKLWLWEDAFMAFATNNTERIRILSTGQVGIGNTAPKSLLHVSGGVQIGDDTADASADKVGCLRYRADATNSYVDMCMQTGSTTYEWVNIKTNTWS